MTQNVEQVEKLEQQVQEDVILKQVVDQFTEELAKLQEIQQQLHKAVETIEVERQGRIDLQERSEILRQQLNNMITSFTKQVAELTSVLAEKLKSFDDKAFTLSKISGEIRRLVKNIDPEASDEVYQQHQQQMQSLLDNITALHHETKGVRMQAVTSIDAIIQKTKQIQAAWYKKLFVALGGLLLATIAISAGTTYFMMKKFPAYIRITGESDISINGGQISIWGNAPVKGSEIKTPSLKK